MTHQQAVAKHAVERYLLDEMPEIERYAFEEHLFDCEACADDVRTGAVMREGVAAGLLPDAITEKAEGITDKAEGTRHKAEQEFRQSTQDPALGTHDPRPPSTTWRAAVPWAVAAMLAITAGYQSLVVVPDLRTRVVGPSVLTPVTLRGASRGNEPTLTRPATGVISLAVDLTGVAAGARLTYDLRAADGASVASGTAAAPPPGTPLLLLIPASALDSAGRYVLTVATGDAPGSASEDYGFSVESQK
jgi:Putative zinc-finger